MPTPLDKEFTLGSTVPLTRSLFRCLLSADGVRCRKGAHDRCSRDGRDRCGGRSRRVRQQRGGAAVGRGHRGGLPAAVDGSSRPSRRDREADAGSRTRRRVGRCGGGGSAQQPDVEIRALQMPDSPVQSLLAAGGPPTCSSSDPAVSKVSGAAAGLDDHARRPVRPVPGGGGYSGLEGGLPFEDTAGYAGNPGQVVLGYDGSSASNRAAAFAFRHAAATGTGVVAVSVEPGRGEPETEEIDPENATPGSDTSAFHSRCSSQRRPSRTCRCPSWQGTGRPAEVLLRRGSQRRSAGGGQPGFRQFRRPDHGLGDAEGACSCRLSGGGAAPRYHRRDGIRNSLSNNLFHHY